MEKTHISIGDPVDVSVQDGVILIRPVKRLRGRYSLKELIAKMPEDYKPGEEEWGKPTGKEAW